MLDCQCRQCPAQDEPIVNWHRMPWFGAVWGESYGFLHRGYWDCYLVTVFLVVWFVYLKIRPRILGNSPKGATKRIV